MFEVTHCALDLELLRSPVASVIPDAPGRIRCTCTLELAAGAVVDLRRVRRDWPRRGAEA